MGAIRRALGAEPRALFLDSLTDGFVAATLGGIVGITVSVASPSFIGGALGLPNEVIASSAVHVTPILTAAALLCFTAALAATWPAIGAARIDPMTLLRGHGGLRSGRRTSAQDFLCVAQIAIAFMLVASLSSLAMSRVKLERNASGASLTRIMSCSQLYRRLVARGILQHAMLLAS